MKTLHEVMAHSGGIDSFENFTGDVSDVENYYYMYSQSRDSNLLNRNNWKNILEKLGGESESVVIIRIGHWACGWLEHILINPAFPDKVQEAEDIIDALSEYPVVNDSDYYQELWEAANELWVNMSMKERIEECQRRKLSIFLSRKISLPEDLEERFETLASE